MLLSIDFASLVLEEVVVVANDLHHFHELEIESLNIGLHVVEVKPLLVLGLFQVLRIKIVPDRRPTTIDKIWAHFVVAKLFGLGKSGSILGLFDSHTAFLGVLLL